MQIENGIPQHFDQVKLSSYSRLVSKQGRQYNFTINAYRCSIYYPLIKTHDSESRGQEEAGCTRQTSELFTGSTDLKLVNALNKPPQKLSLSYQGLSMF